MGKNIFSTKRKKLQLKQSEVAAILNIDRSTVSKWETGDSLPDQSILLNVAKLYKTTVDSLLGGSEELERISKHVAPPQSKTHIQTLFDKLNEQEQMRVLGYIESILERKSSDIYNFNIRN